ncbi:hypothetical protein SASPL_104142 [Salvia splendens]|uniref:Plant heme peroxidase family profile domain-containing protein n=1 Tax=Salvia splendens TaxID=180675 RepID=A0A8X8YL25_SALSN|nr:hypothetical protein SASPL_104142 [Salvia splendens]
MSNILHSVCVLLCITLSQAAPLEVGFYSNTCPNAESIVESVGCDGSILIDNGADDLERFAAGHLGLGGFGEIESQCPGIVSCADIVAMAARDAIALAGGPVYEVETGRRDRRVSNLNLANDMPDVDDSIDTLISKFVTKGLSPQDLVLLSGAHTIGTTACFFMPRRLYGFNSTSDSDPRISPQFLPELRRMCPKNGDTGARISLDPVTPGRFDSQVMDNIKTGFRRTDLRCATVRRQPDQRGGGFLRRRVSVRRSGSPPPHPTPFATPPIK